MTHLLKKSKNKLPKSLRCVFVLSHYHCIPSEYIVVVHLIQRSKLGETTNKCSMSKKELEFTPTKNVLQWQ
jgi:hypothetical protein